jgi:hypothetical protein
VYKYNSVRMRSKDRPKMRWEDDIVNDLKVLKVPHWITCVNRKIWKGNVIEKATTFDAKKL